MSSQPPPIIRSQIFVEFKRTDDKSVYIDPDQVVAIEYEGAEVTGLRLYALGGLINVKGALEEIALLLAEGRAMASEVSLGAVVRAIRDEIQLVEKNKREVN